MMPFTVVFPFGYHVYSLEFHHCIKHKFRYSCSFLQVVVPAASSDFSIFTTVLKCSLIYLFVELEVAKGVF